MAHQPAVIEGQPASAYQADNPFSWIGTKLAPGTSLDDALRAAKLDHTVRLEKMYFQKPDTSIATFQPTYAEVPRRRAVVRDTDDVVLGTVGKKYKILQYPDAFGTLRHAVTEFGVTIESAGALGIGERAWVLAKMPHNIEVVPGDKIGGYFLMLAGHDGATPWFASLIPWRFACTNAINMALASGTNVFRMTHAVSAQRQLDEIAVMIHTLLSTLETTGETFRSLAERQLTTTELEDYINAVLRIKTDKVTGIAERRRNNILELVWSGNGAQLAGSATDRSTTTAWAALNAVTEYIDHVRPAEPTSAKSRLKANESAMFGANALVKIRALNLARELAEAA